MRTIKFRIWNKKTGTWVDGCGRNTRADLDGVNLFGETILFGGFMSGVSIEDLNECVALQYTGLKDKNDQEIFEGDIVQFNVKMFGTSEDIPLIVKFERGQFGAYLPQRENVAAFPMCFESALFDCQVVGNIYEDAADLEEWMQRVDKESEKMFGKME